jgi:hypothetical protein
MHAGLEGVAWYCDKCDAEIYREVWDTATTLSQLKYEVSPVLPPTLRCGRAATADQYTPHLIWQAFVGQKWLARSQPIRLLLEVKVS